MVQPYVMLWQTLGANSSKRESKAKRHHSGKTLAYLLAIGYLAIG